MKKINFVNGTTIDGASTFNTMQDNIEEVFNGDTSMGSIVVEDIECKNILDYGISSETINGVTFTVNNDKSVTINGTATGSADFYLDFNSKPTLNGTYTLGKGINNYAIQLYILNNNNSIFMGGDTQSITSDLTNQQILKLMIRVVNGQTVNNRTIYPQLELGDKATPYTPHKEFSNKQIYSGNEQVIGTWIDGRNIYKKTIPITFSSSEAYTIVSHGISNFDICIGNEIITPKNAYGISWNSRKDTFMSYISNTEVAIDYPTGTFSGTGYITLYYTKSDT